MTSMPAPPVIVHLTGADSAAALAADVRSGLTAHPKRLPPRWLYDQKGCALFEQITDPPEYYPTRAEREILTAYGPDMAARCGASMLIELGSGTSDKTVALIEALIDAGTLRAVRGVRRGRAHLARRRGLPGGRLPAHPRSPAWSVTSVCTSTASPKPKDAWWRSLAAPSAI